MNEDLQNEVNFLKTNIKTWEEFLNKVETEDNIVIQANGEQDHLMAWDNQIKYILEDKKDSFEYVIGNYELRKGRQQCKEYIMKDIQNLQYAINQLMLNLK